MRYEVKRRGEKPRVHECDKVIQERYYLVLVKHQRRDPRRDPAHAVVYSILLKDIESRRLVSL